jgi:predicted dehydrogenase
VPPDASPTTIDWDRFLGPAPKRPFDANVFFRWRCWWEYSGGVATDLFVHMLTQLHEVMDVSAPKSVVSQGGIYRWNDGRTVPDLLSSLYDYDGLLADLSVNLGNAHGSRGMTILGAEGSLELGFRGLTHYTESSGPDIQRYSTNAWPEAMRKQYYESKGAAGGRTGARPQPPKPKEITVERGPGHQESFVLALRSGSKPKEDQWKGHAAASSAHLANLAFRNGRRMSWDWKTGQTS